MYWTSNDEGVQMGRRVTTDHVERSRLGDVNGVFYVDMEQVCDSSLSRCCLWTSEHKAQREHSWTNPV